MTPWVGDLDWDQLGGFSASVVSFWLARQLFLEVSWLAAGALGQFVSHHATDKPRLCRTVVVLGSKSSQVRQAPACERLLASVCVKTANIPLTKLPGSESVWWSLPKGMDAGRE